jgi:hypothetical protein
VKAAVAREASAQAALRGTQFNGFRDSPYSAVPPCSARRRATSAQKGNALEYAVIPGAHNEGFVSFFPDFEISAPERFVIQS